MRTFITLIVVLVLSSSVASAEQHRDAAIVKRFRATMKKLASKPASGRMSGCGGWECNEATLSLKLPGRLEIRYDKPYGSRVLLDESRYYVYNRSGTETQSSPAEESSLYLLVHSADPRKVRIGSVKTIDRGKQAGSPRKIYQIELLSAIGTSPPLFVYVAKKDFRFMGWRVPGRRGSFVAEVRGLRSVTKLPPRTFRPTP